MARAAALRDALGAHVVQLERRETERDVADVVIPSFDSLFEPAVLLWNTLLLIVLITSALYFLPSQVVADEVAEALTDALADEADEVPAAAAQPVAVEKPSVESLAVESLAVEPPAVEPPSVEPPAVEPPAVEPTVIEPPAVEPTVIDPPAVEPTVVEPPAVEPTVVELAAVEPAFASSAPATPPAVALKVGSTVLLHGLAARPELNGARGTVVKAGDPGSGRVGVRLGAGGSALSLKPSNLTEIAGASRMDARAEAAAHRAPDGDAHVRALREQQTKLRESHEAFQLGNASGYRRSAERASEAASLASVRALHASDDEVSRRECLLQESQCRCLAMQAHLRLGDLPAALREAVLASEKAEASGDVAQRAEAKIAHGTAMLRSAAGTEAGQHALSAFGEAVALCERARQQPPLPGATSRLLVAEGSARSNLARAMHSMDDEAGALCEQRRAVGLRREYLAAVTSDTTARADASALLESHRQLASTLCNYAAMLTQADDLEGARRELEEALGHARSGGDPGVEQSILSNLVNLAAAEGPPTLGGGVASPSAAEQRAAAAAAATQSPNAAYASSHLAGLRDVLERTGRGADSVCCCCLEPLDQPETVLALACGHLLHRKCAESWGRTNPVCPQCKVPMVRP